MLLQITAKHFCAGVGLINGHVVSCAPILHYMAGWTEAKAREYAAGKGWTVTEVTTTDANMLDWWTPESWQNPAHRAMLAVHVSRLTGASVAELVAAFEIYADQRWAQQTALRLGYTPDVWIEITR